MSAGEEKKFVMKHVFKKYPNWDGNYYGPKEEHFGVPWRIRILKKSEFEFVYLDCLKLEKDHFWSIRTKIDNKALNEKHKDRTRNHSFYNDHKSYNAFSENSRLREYLIDGKLTVDFEIEMIEMSGIEIPKVRKFDDDVAKEFSDIVLSTGSQKFYVNKMYLSLHSTYFKSLFLGNFEESEKSIIELKDIDPYYFQKFLEVLYGEAAITDDCVSGILKLADMYDSKTTTERCQEFLIHKSEHLLRDKFHVAVKYNLEELKKKCFSELKTAKDCHSILPDTPSQFSYELWEELFSKAIRVPN